MLVDCDACEVRGPACSDCVVTVLLALPAPAPPVPVELDDRQHRALEVLAASGLVPPLRHAPSPYDDRRGSARGRVG